MIRRYLIPLVLASGLLVACGQAPPSESAAEEDGPEGIVVFPEESRALVAFATGSVALRALTTTREAPGQIIALPDAESVVHAPLNGHLTELHAQVGDRVKAGDPLATLKSADLGAAQSAYLKAKGEAELARREHERQKGLLEAELGSRQELDAAEQRHEAARLEVSQAKEALRLLGLSDEEITRLTRIDPKVVLRAPMAGTVVDRHAAVGQYVQPDSPEPLFELLDLRTVRVAADLPERDFLALSTGLPAKVTLSALPGRSFEGKVAALSPTVDPASRTGQALIDLPNPEGLLKPGMTVNAAFALSRSGVATVPAAALQREGDRAFIYVPLEADRYEEVVVTLGESNQDFVELLSGPQPGATVVTRGSFDLRSHARRDQFGGEH